MGVLRVKRNDVFASALLLFLTFACSSGPADQPQHAAPRVAFLLVQTLSPFEVEIWEAIQRAQRDGLASGVKMLEMKDPTEFETTVQQVSSSGYGVVVGAFFLIKDPFLKVAPRFPATHFVLVYESVPEPEKYPNLRAISYDVQEGSYVCGAVAASMTQTNRVGFMGGADTPGVVKFLAGYEAGLKSVKPAIQLDIAFTGTFVDPDKGHEMALALYERGDDVIMHAANKTGLGLFVASRELDRFAVGVDVDQTELSPETVLCSALSNPGQSVYQTIRDAASGAWTGGNVNWGLDDGVPAAALNEHLLPEEVVTRAHQIEERLRSHEIEGPVSTETR
jgi:basic membrane protein A